MPFKSVLPDIQLDFITTLPQYVLENVPKYASKNAFVDALSGRAITYGQLQIDVKKIGAALFKKGVTKGTVIAILSHNSPDYPVIFHGVISIGAIITSLNPISTPEEMSNQLNDCKCKIIFTELSLLDKAIAVQKNTPCLTEIIIIRGEAPGCTPYSSLLEINDFESPTPSLDTREDIAALPYSSGTTGLPKGVMLTHSNLVNNCIQSLSITEFESTSIVIAVLPFFHIYGITVLMNMTVRVGATVIILPKFEFEPFLRVLQDFKVTHAFLVPPIILALGKHPLVDKYKICIQTITSGAAPLSAEVAMACANRLKCEVKQGYGLTETSPVTHFSIPGRVKNGSVGFLVPNSEVKIADISDGHEITEPNKDGEFLIRGPQVMKGYFNNIAATKNTIDSDGFLHTGDVGYVDNEGYYFIVDRVKELIKYKGFQVPPAELEAILLTHPEINDAAVIPKPDAEAGEIPKAFVVRKPNSTITAQDVINFAATHLAPYKKIREVEFIDQIPKSISGKILRRVLRDKERDKKQTDLLAKM